MKAKKNYYELNKDYYKAKRREYYLANREKCLAQSKAWYDKNKQRHLETARTTRLKKEFNLSPEEYQKLFDLQEGRCPVCARHQNELRQKLCVDHCHKTGRIRGLLCSKCNRSIGALGDGCFDLIRAVVYLHVSAKGNCRRKT